MEVYSYKECEKEHRKEEFKKKIKEKYFQVKAKVEDIWNRDKDYIVVLAPAAISGVIALGKSIARHEDKMQDKKRESRVYDPSLGQWWDLNKPLTNNERLEMETRVANGELRGDVLKDMGKLKR